MVRGIEPPPLANLKPQNPYSSAHLRVRIFSVISCSFIYPCGTGTACCSLLTWTETKLVRQLIVHGAIISSINMMITSTSRGISQLQISITRRISQREIVVTPRTLQLILWGPEGMNVSLEDCETFFNLAGGIYPETTCLIEDGSSPSLFRNHEIYLLFWSTTPAKLCWLFRAILRNIIPRNLIFVVFTRIALICSSE